MKKPWVGYPGTPAQQGYAEALDHGYILWDIRAKGDWDVEFRPLPNFQPYVTLDWDGSNDDIIALAETYPTGSRFRIRSVRELSHADVQNLIFNLKDTLHATEVAFKSEDVAPRPLTTGVSTLAREDLRSVATIQSLMREHYEPDDSALDEDVERACDLVDGYVSALAVDDVKRNVRWSLKRLEFSNLFCYGEDNFIDFDNTNGIVGLLGPNRIGKSSIIGCIMYVLFNSTDRGNIKNIHVMNARKQECSARLFINVDGVDYVINRTTVKSDTVKRGTTAATELIVLRVEPDGELTNMVGEQRADTEKVIRSLIGTQEDFMLTLCSAQDEGKVFISQGAVKRRQTLCRFLDLDVFDGLHEQARTDLMATKGELKALPERDWNTEDTALQDKMKTLEADADDRDALLVKVRADIDELRGKITGHSDFEPVTEAQLARQRVTEGETNTRVTSATAKRDEVVEALKKNDEKLTTAVALLDAPENALHALRQRSNTYQTLKASVKALRHEKEKEATALKQQERSLKILDDVPCGDEYPTCKFIKDAHANKKVISKQRTKVDELEKKLGDWEMTLEADTEGEGLAEKIEKLEKMNDALAKLRGTVSEQRIKLAALEVDLATATTNAAFAKKKTQELEAAMANNENNELVSLRSQVDELNEKCRLIDEEKTGLTLARGRACAELDTLRKGRADRGVVVQRLRAFELAMQAFSRKGIPGSILTSQLPVINAELSRILSGIVDFRVELEIDDNDTNIYINYGDSRRLIELCSGMEKMIASLALRVALTLASTLPKSDILMIDEGFGSLDEASVEACNRLISSLKRHFRAIVIVTHVPNVKDVADTIIEITKNEKDSCVRFQ